MSDGREEREESEKRREQQKREDREDRSITAIKMSGSRSELTPEEAGLILAAALRWLTSSRKERSNALTRISQ